MIQKSLKGGKLRILLLGPPAVFLDEQPYQIERRLNRSLLYYLATQEGPVSRAELIELLWPDGDEESGRKRLRETLSKLRRDLPDASLLVTYQDQVSLDFDRLYVDHREFQALVNQTERALQMHTDMPLPEPTYQQLVKATRLWRSPRFMAGVNLPSSPAIDSWLAATAQTSEFAFERVLVRLAEHCALIGDLDTALGWVRQATEVEPYNDENHLHALEWLRDLGRRGDALKYFHQVRQDYQRDGYLLPDEIVQLGASLQEEAAHPPVDETRIWRSATLQVPLIGRDHLLSQLRLSFQRGGMILLSGEAGSGKSRLVHELFQSLEPVPRLLVALGRAPEAELPFQPLVDMLRNNILVSEWKRLSDPWVEQMALLLPELTAQRAGVEPPENVPPAANRQNIYEALRQLLLLITRHQRILFFLDDAQWCDDLTLGALIYLLEREFFKEHGLLVVAVRTEDCNRRLENFFQHPRLSALAENVRLPLFNREQVAALAQFALGEAPPAELVDRLRQDTGGNPLFLLETLRALLETSELHDWAQWNDRLPLAGSVHAVVRDRLRGLNRQRQKVLLTAAVIGHVFTLDVLQAATNLDQESLVAAIEELEHDHLIQAEADDGAPSAYSFIHGKLREVLLLEQSDARRRLLNQRVARAIELCGGDLANKAEVLARHYHAAGEPAAAYSYWLSHAEWAGEQGHPDQAYAAYRQAESLFFRLDRDLPDPMIYRLYRGWGNLAFDTEDLETLERNYAAMQRIGEERRSAQLIGAGWSGLFLANTLKGQPGLAQRSFERATPLVEQSGDLRDQIDLHNRRGLYFLFNNRFPEALDVLSQALELGTRAVDQGAWEARVTTHCLLATVHNTMGWPQRAYHLARLAVAESYRLRRTFLSTYASAILSYAAYLLGRYEEAIEVAVDACAQAERKNEWRHQAMLRLNVARSAYVLGRLDEAWAYTQNALQTARLHRYMDLACSAYVNLGDMLRALGDLDGAMEQYLLAVSDAVGGTPVVEAQNRLGLTLAMQGKTEEAAAYITRALDFGLQTRADLITLPAQIGLAMLAAWQGDEERALQLAETVTIESRQRGLVTLKQSAALLGSQLAARRGDPEAVREPAQRLVEQGRQLGHIWQELIGLSTLVNAAAAPDRQEAERLRINALIERLLANARTPELRVRVEQFRRSAIKT